MKMRIRPFRRKTLLERTASDIRSAVPDIHPSKGVKAGLTAAVATTAASAAISAMRRRTDGAGGSQ